MSEMKHTEGPWTVSNDPGDWNVYPDGNGMSCYQAIRAGNTIVGFAVARSRGFVEPDTSANAHLFAAAPELLEALQECIGVVEGLEAKAGIWKVIGDKARAALSKAAPKGEESKNG